jgi:hypothetical protein
MKRGPRYTARKEAQEESGVKGSIGRKPLGVMTFRKKVDGRRRKVALRLYPLSVKKRVKRFPERKQRTRRWFTVKRAMAHCDNPALRRLLEKLKKVA